MRPHRNNQRVVNRCSATSSRGKLGADNFAEPSHHLKRRPNGMRADIVVGAIFPDYELSDLTGKRSKLSDLQGPDPLAYQASAASIRAVAAFAVAFTASPFPLMPPAEYAPSSNISNWLLRTSR